MELGRFKTRIENDSWETEISDTGKQDVLFQNIIIENDKLKGILKSKDTTNGTETKENNFLIYKKGESFIIKTDFFITNPEELEIKFNNHDLLLFDKKANIEIRIYNKESYN